MDHSNMVPSLVRKATYTEHYCTASAPRWVAGLKYSSGTTIASTSIQNKPIYNPEKANWRRRCNLSNHDFACDNKFYTCFFMQPGIFKCSVNVANAHSIRIWPMCIECEHTFAFWSSCQVPFHQRSEDQLGTCLDLSHQRQGYRYRIHIPLLLGT